MTHGAVGALPGRYLRAMALGDVIQRLEQRAVKKLRQVDASFDTVAETQPEDVIAQGAGVGHVREIDVERGSHASLANASSQPSKGRERVVGSVVVRRVEVSPGQLPQRCAALYGVWMQKQNDASVVLKFGFVVLCALACVACSGATDSGPRTPGLTFLDDGEIEDTIEAVIGEPIRVSLRDSSGNAIAAAAIQFEARQSGLTSVPGYFGTIALAPSAPYDSVRVASTDAQGQVVVSLRLGNRTGDGFLVASRVGTSWRDSIFFTVRHGTTVLHRDLIRDSALWVGNSFDVGGASYDRAGNRVSDYLGLERIGDAVSLSNGVVTGAQFGSARIVGTKNSGQKDTLRVVVVPRGKLAYALAELGDRGIYGMNTDGSEQRWIYRKDPFPNTPYIAHPTFSPDGSKIAFVEGPSLRIVDAAGGTPQVLVPSGVSEEEAPQFSRDGEWVYYSRGSTFWRVPSQGGTTTQVSPNEPGGIDTQPSPSVSGDTIVYHTNRGGQMLRLLTLSGQVITLNVPGAAPRWSPTGNRIGYVHDPDTLHFMQPNGTLIRRGTTALQRNFGWSPDGEWVIGIGQDWNPGFNAYEIFMHMVHASNDMLITLRTKTPSFGSPTWGPLP
jgi:hypothetical protein